MQTGEPVALVTGGSRGIGRAVVRELTARGWQVAFTWHSAEEAAAELVSECGGRALALPLDLADRCAPARVVEEVEERLGAISGLVNNAGMQTSRLLAMTSDAVWDRVIDLNLGGVFRCCRAVLPSMVRQRRGAIVNVASLAALHGVAGLTAYSAAKAGVLGLTRGLAREVGRRNVRVNAVVLGFVDTSMTRDLPESVQAALRRDESLPDGVAPEAAAAAVVHLLSDEASATTGQHLVVDAGTSG